MLFSLQDAAAWSSSVWEEEEEDEMAFSARRTVQHVRFHRLGGYDADDDDVAVSDIGGCCLAIHVRYVHLFNPRPKEAIP